MVREWPHLLSLFSFFVTAKTAGQHLCPISVQGDVFFDDTTSLPPREELVGSKTIFVSIEATSPTRLSSSPLVPTKLDLPTAVNSIAVQMRNASHLAAVDPDGKNETNDTFISFDQWREARLKEEVADTRVSNSWDTTDGDAIGDGLEVELDFLSNTEEKYSSQVAIEAGKHRFNFASLDCAATIVKTNVEASGASSILIDNKDKYLLNPCSVPNKFVVIELCQDILVEEIAIANFEFFSSTFKRVRFSVSDRFPVAKNGWTVLNEFEAENSRNLQKFSISNPQIWARFLLIEILSHHDNEYYCPISLVQVHGKTMMDEFKMDNLKPSAQKTSKEEIVEAEDILERDETEECNLWPSIDFEHMTVLSKTNDVLNNCTCRLSPLKFEEFLRDLNGTYCPAPLKDSIYASTSTVPSATTEESIFKNIVKRLSSLESNTTLSILYMEEQGKLLSKSFNTLEKAQISKFDKLVSMFNDTMMDNLLVLRNFANQLKDQSIKILEEQKLNNDKFTTHTIQRMESLEQELKMQRNLAYVASFILVFTLLYLFLSRESDYNTAMEGQSSASPKKYVPSESPHVNRISSLPASLISSPGSSIASG